MRRPRLVLLTAAALLAAPPTVRAQRAGARNVREHMPPAQQAQGGTGRGQALARRARIQREIRQAFTRAVRNQVGLTEDQMRKLAPINQKYVRERQQLVRDERATRIALRDELAKPQPDQAKVSQYFEQWQEYPRKRLDLNDAEYKELATIMTPVQLARFRALQERVQRQLNQMQAARGGGIGMPRDTGGGGR